MASTPWPRRRRPPPTGPIDIVHAGEIFTGRSLVPVLEAARRLAARHPARPIRVITYGELPAAEWARIRAGNLESFVEVRPRIPFGELFAELQRAHVLLAVVGDHMLYSTPYKVYDYMAAGRPILAIAPRGAALFELLAESGAGVCASNPATSPASSRRSRNSCPATSRRCAPASTGFAGRTSRCSTAR